MLSLKAYHNCIHSTLLFALLCVYYSVEGNGSLLESMKDTFQLQDELSKENYHFVLSEALISVIEEVSSC